MHINSFLLLFNNQSISCLVFLNVVIVNLYARENYYYTLV